MPKTTTNGDIPTAADSVADAVNAVPDAEKPDIAKAVVGTLPEPQRAGVISESIKELGDKETADVVTDAVRSMSAGAHDDLIAQLAPDQAVTNDIWRWIVRTFAFVLMGATAGLVGAVIVSFWRKVDPAMIQILLTVFTTTAGILAGFVSGRASSTARARA